MIKINLTDQLAFIWLLNLQVIDLKLFSIPAPGTNIQNSKEIHSYPKRAFHSVRRVFLWLDIAQNDLKQSETALPFGFYLDHDWLNMASPLKTGKKWKHRVMVAGVRHVGTFDTKAAALAWEASKRVAPGATIGAQTCADAFERYEREVSKTKRGYRWEALRLAALGKSDLGKVKLSDVNAVHVAAWRDERLRSVQGATVTREMNLLSHVFSVARKEWKWIGDSPTADVARPRAAPARDRRITQAEIDLICAALGHVEAPPQTKQQAIALAFLFAIETAMRAGEICALAGADVTGRVAHLRMTKNGTSRDVGLSPRAVEIWALVPDGFGITSASLDAMFRKARERAGVDGLTFHDTRHEAITRLAGKLGVLDLARMVGHRDIRQLQAYYNATADDIAAKL